MTTQIVQDPYRRVAGAHTIATVLNVLAFIVGALSIAVPAALFTAAGNVVPRDASADGPAKVVVAGIVVAALGGLTGAALLAGAAALIRMSAITAAATLRLASAPNRRPDEPGAATQL